MVEPIPSKNTFFRRFFGSLAALLVLATAATLALPSLIKTQAETRGSQALGRTLTVGAVAFKPWTLELTLSDIQIASLDGKSTQLAVSRIYVDAAFASLWKRAPVLDALAIEQPHLRITHAGQGRYDVDDLIARFQPDPKAPPTPPSAPTPFALHNLVLTGGSVDFSDQAGGASRVHTVRALELALPFLSTLPLQRDVTVQPRLAMVLNGSRLEAGAEATPFAQAPRGALSLQFAKLDLAPYLPYLPPGLPVQLKSAVLDSSLNVVFEQAPVQKVVVSGSLAASGVRVDDPAGGPVLVLASVRAAVKDFRPLEQRLQLDSLTLQAPRVWLARKADGSLQLPGAGGPQAQAGPGTAAAPGAAASSQATPNATPQAQGWSIALDTLALQDAQVRWTDHSVAPASKLLLADLDVKVRHVQWPLTQAAQWEASASLQALDGARAKPAALALQGKGTADTGTLKATLSDLSLALAAPYLRPYWVPQVQGVLGLEAQAQWRGGEVQWTLPRAALRDAALLPPAGASTLVAKDLPSFKALEVEQVVLDASKRSATVGALALRGPKLRVARGDDGQWMFSHWLPSAAQAAPGKPVPPSPPWSVKLAELTLDDGTLSYVDRLPAKTVFLELSALQARMRNLEPDGKKPVPLTVSAKVRSLRTDPGSLRFDGTLMWDPLVAQGSLVASQLPVQAVAPYVLGGLRLDLRRADTSFKGQVRYAQLAAGPHVQVQGDAAIEELTLNSLRAAAPVAAPVAAPLAVAADAAPLQPPESPDSASANANTNTNTAPRQSEELLSWKALSVPGIVFSMEPGAPLRLAVREVSLSDFYARLIISPEGRLVLQDIVRPEDAGPTPPAAASATPPGTAAPSAALEPQIDMGPIKLVNGRVAFSDRFIQPNYSASLTELAGSLGRFSSQPPQGGVQMADLALRGRAEGTASLDITGKLNPLAKPLALDIQGRVRDLELSPLSSYAIKYAGYGIERGKLSLDVQYKVAPDGQLQASNKLVLNQLVFGDEVPGAANRLPVKLAVALLADRNGVIDLDLPLSGSLNDPQFRVWPIVWKVVGNVIAKALTSPFQLLAGIFGGGGDAAATSNTVAFEPGSTRISAAGQQSLDQVAKALLDRPSLRLTVVGSASLERETDAIRRERLAAQLLAEKRRMAASTGQDVTAVAAVTDAEAPALLKEAYRRAGIKKPRNLLGLTKDLPAADMEALLLASIAVDDDTVRELALNRSLAVRDYLTARQLPSDRLFLGSSKTSVDADWQPRAELELQQ